MKRVLIVSLVVLELALVALVWWASTRGSRTDELAPQSPASTAAPAADRSKQDLELVAEPTRTDTPREERTPLAAAAPQVHADPARSLSAVRCLVVFADDGKPVGGGEAYLTCTPATPTGFVPFPGATKRDSAGTTRIHLPIEADGSLVFELAPGSQLKTLDVSASSDALNGPRTPANADRRFAHRRLFLQDKLGSSPLELRVEVQRGLELSGSVMDANTGRGLSGAVVRVRPNLEDPLQVATGLDGCFCIAGFERKEFGTPFVLEFAHPDCIPAERTLQEDELAPGAAPLRLVLQRGLRVGGTLVDAEGHALPGVAVQLRAAGLGAGGIGVVSVRSDEHGDFLFRGLPQCERTVLSIEEQLTPEIGILALQRDLGPLRADVSGLRIELASFAELVVGAKLRGGFALAPREFEVLVAGSAARSVRVDPQRLGRVVRVPYGREVELVAYAAARSSTARPGAFARGARKLLVEPRGDVPQPFVIELDEELPSDLPAPPVGSRQFDLPGPEYLRGAVDVELVDAASGRALDGELWISLAAPGAGASFGSLREGRVRIRGVPGTYPIEVETQDRLHFRYDLFIPEAGLGHDTWRVGNSR